MSPAYILFTLSAICFITGLILEHRAVNHHRRPRVISTVCMDCGALICGPSPQPHHPISHGICKRCHDKWQNEILTFPRVAHSSHTSH